MKSKVVGVYVVELLIAVTFASNTCETYYGKLRDCTCGVQYRDVETRCCSVSGCSLPHVRTENLTCPLTCLNSGQKLFDTNSRIGCKCNKNYDGVCCEKGEGSRAAYYASRSSGDIHPCMNTNVPSSPHQLRGYRVK